MKILRKVPTAPLRLSSYLLASEPDQSKTSITIPLHAQLLPPSALVNDLLTLTIDIGPGDYVTSEDHSAALVYQFASRPATTAESLWVF